MDNDAISNGNNQMQDQQLQPSIAEPILSTMTSVTPISESVAEDFEPDPKWEMTTLEKASIISDAQMESVIDHVVELGGGQQFSHALSHHEDKEKAVESIQREIIGCRNPMESLAEVASQQPTLSDSVVIEASIHDVAEPQKKANPFVISDVVESSKQDDLTTKQTVPEKSKPIRMELEANSADVATESTAITAASEKISSEEHISLKPPVLDTQSAELDTKPTSIEEPHHQPAAELKSTLKVHDITSVNGGHGQHDDRPVEQEKTKEQAVGEIEQSKSEPVYEEPIIEETVEEIEDQMDIIENQESEVKPPSPVVEEPPSADEQDQESKTSHDDANKNTVQEEVTVQEIVEDVSSEKDGQEKALEEAESIVAKAESEEPVKRKSSRRVKVQEITADETPKTESRRVSRRSKNQKAAVEETKTVQEETAHASELVADHEVQKDEEKESAVLTAEVSAKDSKEETEELEKTDVKDEEEILDSKADRPVRAVRTRAPKRPAEEVSPQQVQPPKKQVKRSRGSSDQNKSYEATKSTPTIKLSFRSRATISTSDPGNTRPDPRYEVYDHDGDSNGKYKCSYCKYSTDRLNNIVFHHKRSTEFVSGVRCPGVLRAAEEQRAEIIRLQQTPKGNKRKSLR